MSLSNLPLSYCTNVHPGRTLAEIEEGLDHYTVKMAARFGSPLAAGLWLADSVCKEILLSDPDGRRLSAGLARRGLTCHTLNAFPFGDFHSPRVKEHVYEPSWAERPRLEFTKSAARILTGLLPEGVEGSISTLPLGFPGLHASANFHAQCADNLIAAAVSLHRLEEQTGRTVRRHRAGAGAAGSTRPIRPSTFSKTVCGRSPRRRTFSTLSKSTSACASTCATNRSLSRTCGRRWPKSTGPAFASTRSHITCAIELENPATNVEGRRALANYVEPRYLHQTKALLANGRVLQVLDLDRAVPTSAPNSATPSGGEFTSTSPSTPNASAHSKRNASR